MREEAVREDRSHNLSIGKFKFTPPFEENKSEDQRKVEFRKEIIQL